MIKEIKLINFRNFKDITFNTNNNLVILLGMNAVGKTSVLEAIYYLSTTKSHRTNNYLNLINNEASYSNIMIKFDNNDYKIFISNKNNKLYYINNKEINRYNFLGQVKTILFSPYDLNLVNGSKEDRRKFLDLNISVFVNEYLKDLVNYKKILKRRNEILKNKDFNKTLLKVLTDTIYPYAVKICKLRQEFVNKINKYLNKICHNLDIDLISIELDNVNLDYNNTLNKDIYYKTTTIGPHRTSFSLKINNKDLKSYGSQGQIKLGIIVLKLAIYEVMKEKNNPILLLDDVFAELDYEKQIKLVKYLDNYQTFITTTTLSEIPKELLDKALIIELRKDD